ADLAGCCRRSPRCPDRRSSHSASIAAAPAPLRPRPTSPVDTRRNPDGTAGPPPAPISTSPPAARSDPTRSVCPVSFPHRLLSGSSPSAPAAENNCPTTSDSRPCTGFLSGSSQNPQSSARQPLPLPGSLLLVGTPPRPPTWKYKTAWPHSSAPPTAGWLIEFGSITPPIGIEIGRARFRWGVSNPALSIASWVHSPTNGYVSRSLPIIPDGQISRDRFETSAFCRGPSQVKRG